MGQFRTVDIMRENNHKLVFGINYSYNNGISSRRGRYSGDILYNDSLGNTLLPDYIKYGFDFFCTNTEGFQHLENLYPQMQKYLMEYMKELEMMAQLVQSL